MVVPVLNECDNVAPLVDLLRATLDGLAWEGREGSSKRRSDERCTETMRKCGVFTPPPLEQY